jgi:hypothetical protein
LVSELLLFTKVQLAPEIFCTIFAAAVSQQMKGSGTMKGLTALIGVLALASCEGSEQVIEAQTSALTTPPKRIRHDDPVGGCNSLNDPNEADWYPNYCKTECTVPLTGMSSSFAAQGDCSVLYFLPADTTVDPGPGPGAQTEYTHLVACNTDGAPAVTLNSAYTLKFGASNDQRFPNVGRDWAPGLDKGECDNSSAITAVASDHYFTGDGSCFDIGELEFYDSGKRTYGIQGARCSRLAAPAGQVAVATDCQTLDFSNASVNEAGNRTSWSGEDWDYGYLKAQCGPGRFIKGIAHRQLGAGSGKAAMILCCGVQYVNLP